MKQFLLIFALFLTTPVIADVCPAGYTPTKYTQLEYIESTGTQYIDTGVYPNTLSYNTELFVDVQYTQDNNYNFSGVLGTTDANGMYFKTDVKSSTELSMQAGGGDTETKIIVDSILNRHRLKWNTDTAKCYVDNQEYSLFVSPSVFSIDAPFTLFKNNCVVQNCYGKGKVYSAYIKDNSVFVRDFIPAKRNNDGEIGMYDTVTGHFFTNAGTGEFIAGPEILTENTCFPCPPNTYKDFVGNGDCTPCPDTFSSPSGAKSINECGRILHVGDYIAHMPFGRRTEHGLCTMFDGKKYCADVYEKQ